MDLTEFRPLPTERRRPQAVASASWVLRALPALPVHSELSVLPGGGGGSRRRRAPGGGAAGGAGSEAERRRKRQTEDRGPGPDQLRARDERSSLQQGNGQPVHACNGIPLPGSRQPTPTAGNGGDGGFSSG